MRTATLDETTLHTHTYLEQFKEFVNDIVCEQGDSPQSG